MYQKNQKILQAKSYTSIYDIFGPAPFNNVFYKSPRKGKEQSIAQTCETSGKQSIDVDHPDPEINQKSYITYEVFNGLNKISSHRKVIPSTSTLFYDLDDVAKRHSFNCLTELSLSNANFLKVMSSTGQPVSFKAKSNTIVQECATQIYPKIFHRDSLNNTLKTKTKYPYKAMLSSEIFLRDDNYNEPQHKKHHRRHVTERPQKFWSYAKYRTEYTKSIPEEKKRHAKDHGNRVENPCPCQLFSYACPCSDNKSLTGLAQNNKISYCVDQITSTTKTSSGDKNQKREAKHKKMKGNLLREEKPTNTSVIEMVEAIVPEKDSIESMLAEAEKNNRNIRPRSRRKSRKILCPKCKEHVKVVISISNTEEEGFFRRNCSSMFRNHEPSGSTYAYRASPNITKDTIEGDVCTHNPPCELLPVCQILPDNSTFKDTRHLKKTSQKFSPRIIRITKACRHHPPCTVVPSCQRMNVLKNNCEFIPPCLHRPRCVNLPLCVPLTKNFQYDEPTSIDGAQDTVCHHVPKCKHVPACQHNIYANVPEHGIGTTHVQNTCEFLNNLNTPTFLMQPNPEFIPYSFSPVESPMSPLYKLDKSFQIDSRNYIYAPAKNEQSNDAVVFIRDVGCQFRNKNYSANDSFLQSRKSSNSFDFVAVKSGTVYTNYHTLRYEDKFTTPQEQCRCASIASNNNSVSPSNGRRAKRCFSKDQSTTHYSKPNYVIAFSTVSENVAKSQKSENFNTSILKSRHLNSCLRNKYKKMFSVKRRKKSKCSTSSFHSRRTMCPDGYL